MFHGKRLEMRRLSAFWSGWAARRFYRDVGVGFVEAEGENMRRQALCAWRRETEGGAS
jgi:hypothetical protein